MNRWNRASTVYNHREWIPSRWPTRIVQLYRRRTNSVGGTIADEPIYSAPMSSLLQPLHLLLMMFAGWVNRHQLDVIDYLQEENRVLKERRGGRRIGSS